MQNWLQGSTIYHIYPRSFKDSSDKGTGDLKGIIEKLDYIESLSVDGIWISPFFLSPMHDFGYDVADYKSIDPIFGTLLDFSNLIHECKRRNIKMIIDLVLNHTSIEHKWFKESRQNKENEKADWYVWCDSKPDGTPPNNWLSVFGGGAWTWEARRGQYYLHSFLKEQPDLNLRNIEVQEAVLDQAKFWLDLGVDGFRLDACNFYYYDEQFRDNPAKDSGHLHKGIQENNPYSKQKHIYDKSRPDNIEFLQLLRNLVDQYPHEPVLIAEVFADNNKELMSDYIEPHGPLHSAYSFEFLGDEFSATQIKKEMKNYEADQWPTWTFGNHDVPRLYDRWKINYPHEVFVKQIYSFLACTRGTTFIYQGDELGLPQVNIPFSKIVDPYGLEFYPDYKGRDGCRTPMPWIDNLAGVGFTDSKESWLPIPYEHRVRAVNLQEVDDESALNHVRRCLGYRKSCHPLKEGKMKLLDSKENELIFRRFFKEESICCYFNFSDEETEVIIKEKESIIENISLHYNAANKEKIIIQPGGCLLVKEN